MGTSYLRDVLVLLVLGTLHNNGLGFVSGHSCSYMADSMELGRTVTRGPDWKYGNQDGTPYGQGLVTGMTEYGWYNVEWDSTLQTFKYQVVHEEKCDLKLVRSSSGSWQSSNLSCKEMAARITVGCTVERGRDWKWGDQDGNPPGQGKVTAKHHMEGWYVVTWDCGTKQKYRMYHRSACEVQPVRRSTETEEPRPRHCAGASSRSVVMSHAPSSNNDATVALSKEAARLQVEANTLSHQTAKVNLQEAQARLLAEEARKREADNLADASKVALQAARDKAKAEADQSRIDLDAANTHAKAEAAWLTNSLEDLDVERTRRQAALDAYQKALAG